MPTRGIRTHDGFYTRLALGPALLSSSWGSTGSVSVTGMGPALELAFGGTVGRGVVIGGGVYGASFLSPKIAYSGQSNSIDSASVTTVGPFVDWYPSPEDGWHVQGSVGYAITTYSGSSGKDSASGTGFGGLLGLGYEAWVADEWSIGGMLRCQYASASISASGSSSTVDTSVLVPAFVVTATYH